LPNWSRLQCPEDRYLVAGLRVRLPAMADDRSAAELSVGDRDPELAEVLDKGLDEYNFAATGTSEKDQGSFSVKVTGADGEIIGGLTAWTWAGLCGAQVREVGSVLPA
jgi:hypothetical protein